VTRRRCRMRSSRSKSGRSFSRNQKNSLRSQLHQLQQRNWSLSNNRCVRLRSLSFEILSLRRMSSITSTLAKIRAKVPRVKISSESSRAHHFRARRMNLALTRRRTVKTVRKFWTVSCRRSKVLHLSALSSSESKRGTLSSPNQC
jgi:hypothetical protein